MIISLKAVSSYYSVTFICPVLEVVYLISKTLWCRRIKLIFFLSLSVSGRGGQSALRFARLRMEKRHNYVRKVAETAVQLFVSNDKVNVAGLVLAGSADFKTELSQSDMFDPVRVKTVFSYAQRLIQFLPLGPAQNTGTSGTGKLKDSKCMGFLN